MKLVFIGPEAFNLRKCVKTSGFNPAGLQGEMQSSLLCLIRQAAIWTPGQTFLVLRKGSTSGKVDHSCWEAYGRWLCCSTKLVFPSVGCNRIARGSDQAEGRERIIYQFFSSAEQDIGLCISVYSQFSAPAQLQAERNSVRKKEEIANRVPEDEQEIWTSE